MKNLHVKTAALALVAALSLTACGGSDDGDAGPAATTGPDQVPASATVSPAAFSAYLAALPASESGEPLAVTGLAPPVSDSDEPASVR